MIIVEKEFFKRRMLLRNKTKFTSCVTTQCIDKNLLYTETDCQTDKEIEAACSEYRSRWKEHTVKYIKHKMITRFSWFIVGTFFSCTFEPGDPCFLSQTLEDDFDWTITKVCISLHCLYWFLYGYKTNRFCFIVE